MRPLTLALVILAGCAIPSIPESPDGSFADADVFAPDAGTPDAGECANSDPCQVAWPACATRTCSDVAGCGAIAPVREGFACDDGNASTRDDSCQAGTCAGVPLLCSVNNGGCGAAACIGNDPAPPTCQCSGRWNVMASGILDTQTDLMWQRTVNGGYLTEPQGAAHCASLGVEWRLPTKEEGASLVVGIVGPRIDSCAFPGAASEIYWASTPVAGQPGTYWATNLASGSTPGGTSGDVGTTPHLVRCIRLP